MEEKKIYISPEVEFIHVLIERHLMSNSDGGHYGGNPWTTDDDDLMRPKDNSMTRVGTAGTLWVDEDEFKNNTTATTSSSLWE